MRRFLPLVGAGVVAGATSAVCATQTLTSIPADKGCRGALFTHTKPSGKLRQFTLDEVRNHNSPDTIVTFEGGVYDVTSWMDAHPGGSERIKMVNGYDLSKYWEVYQLHYRDHILQLLEEYRIGTLSPADAKKAVETTEFPDVYSNDPPRTREAELRVCSRKPWNSEPMTPELVKNYFTPNDVFFVRNHNPVPDIDPNDYHLEIHSNPAFGIPKTVSFSLEQLKTQFPATTVISALQCAGNRQDDFVTPERPLFVAPHWRNAAIGCARWTGVKVRDVLARAGADVNGMCLGTAPMHGMKIVNFIAEDTDETATPYAGVLPIEKVLDPFGDTLLCYEMNGETLPRDHGYPIRLLAPGHAGCRNVKWVREIIVSEEASELDSGSRLDRHFAPDISFSDHRLHVDPKAPGWLKQIVSARVSTDRGPVVQTLPVQSIVCLPADRSVITGQKDVVEVRGVAWSGAGRGICRVEISADGGATFSAAEILPPPAGCQFGQCPSPESGMGRNWAWCQWRSFVMIPPETKEKLRRGDKVRMEIVSKAIDGDFNQQPELMNSLWNVLGICVNHWSRVHITLDPSIHRDAPDPKPPMPPLPGTWQWPQDEQ